MTPGEILALVAAGIAQVMKLVDLAQQIHAGTINPDTIKPEDLRFPSAEEVLAALRGSSEGPVG